MVRGGAYSWRLDGVKPYASYQTVSFGFEGRGQEGRGQELVPDRGWGLSTHALLLLAPPTPCLLTRSIAPPHPLNKRQTHARRSILRSGTRPQSRSPSPKIPWTRQRHSRSCCTWG